MTILYTEKSIRKWRNKRQSIYVKAIISERFQFEGKSGFHTMLEKRREKQNKITKLF